MAEPIDFNAHRLAVLNKLPTRKADAFRGTGDNHIAWVERVQRRAKFNEFGYGENQVIGVIVLFEYTVQAGAYARMVTGGPLRSEEHTSELQSRGHLVCRLLLEKKKNVYQQ